MLENSDLPFFSPRPETPHNWQTYSKIDQQRSRMVEMLGSDSLVLRVSRVALKRKGRANPYHVCFFFFKRRF
jgi:hypothetical protein